MSILSHEYGFLFLHVAKTGGRSINLTLAKRCPNSARFNTRKLDPNVDVLGRRPGLEVRQHMTDEQWDNYFKFAFVRNPWDRAVSIYEHIRSSRELNATGKIRYLDEITGRLKIEPVDFTFEVFVRAVLRDRVFDNYHWDSQMLSFTDESSQNVFDFIGCFENLQADFDFACRRIGFPLTILPHHNRTIRRRYDEYYTAETRQIVADVYHEDIEMFDYRFGIRSAGGESKAHNQVSLWDRFRSHLSFHRRRFTSRIRPGFVRASEDT